MVYQIESKNDLSGVMLLIRFPEAALDRKALATIENEHPPFLVPFTCRSVDGMIECSYRPGIRSKLQYRYGKRPVSAFVEFWSQILQPLLDCDDWFLKPFSFVLDSQYLYYDRDRDSTDYLYVPSLPDCVEFADLHRMVQELSHENQVEDQNLEIKVLQAIMQDFQPKQFLSMLYAESGKSPVSKIVESVQKPTPQQSRISEEHPPQQPQMLPEKPIPTPETPMYQEADDVIHIDLNVQKIQKKQKKESPPKKEKAPKEPKKGFSLFGKKKEEPKVVIAGAGADESHSGGIHIPASPAAAKKPATPSVSYDTPNVGNVTQMRQDVPEGAMRLQLIGKTGLPREIVIEINPGQVFTIGRYDTTVGAPQSNFEFESRTAEVSRHHAAIEREADGAYYLVDLASMAGTFVDGVRLKPNIPYQIAKGNRISFGTCGVDYVWSE